MVWVCLPNTPFQYYHKSTLRAIANIVDDLIKIDYKTGSVQHGKFSRMAVGVNLNNPLISRFKIEDRVQKVEYEDLPIICYQCGRFVHVVETCNFHQKGGRHHGVHSKQ